MNKLVNALGDAYVGGHLDILKGFNSPGIDVMGEYTYGPINDPTWIIRDGAVLLNNSVAPDKRLTAGTYTFTDGSGTNGFDFYQTIYNVYENMEYTVSMWVKLGTATNFCVTVTDSYDWNTIGGKCFTVEDGLSTTEWKKINYTFTGVSSNKINLYIGAHSETLTQQTSGTAFLWNFEIITNNQIYFKGDLISNSIQTEVIGRTDDENLIQLPSAENVIINGNLNITGDLAINGLMGDILETKVLHLQHRIPNASVSGTFTAGAWQNRPINYLVKNTIDGATFDSITYRFILPAGKYKINTALSAFYVQDFCSRLYNISDDTVDAIGTWGMSNAEAGYNNTTTDINAEIEIMEPKEYQLQMYCSTTRLNEGFGYKSQVLDATLDQIHANVYIQDVNSIRGAKGEKGDTGTITIGNVVAGESPEDASITNTGTSSSAVLDFILPKGNPGTTVPDMTGLTYVDYVDFDNDKVIIYDDSAQAHKVTNPNNIVKPEPQQGIKKLIAETHYGGNGVLTYTNIAITWGQKYGSGVCSLFDGAPTADGTYQPGFVVPKPAGETGNLVDIDMWTFGGCALYDTGNFYTAGLNTSGGLGLGNTTNQALLTLSNTDVVEYVRPAKMSYENSAWRLFIKKTDGYWYGAGNNVQGALGIGNIVNQTSWVQLTALGTDVKKIYNFGTTYGCTIVEKNDGSIWGAGNNNHGQLGIGNTTNQTSFIDLTTYWGILIEYGERVLDIQGEFGYYSTTVYGYSHIYMLISTNGVTGKIKAAGYNGFSTLGDGTVIQRTTPVAPLHNSTTIKSIHSAGGSPGSFYALEADGSMWVNGYNIQGQLGVDNVVNQSTPIQTSFTSPIKNIFANSHSNTYSFNSQAFVQLEDGRIYGTGYNTHGQLGDGTVVQKNVWTLIPYDFATYGYMKEVKWNGYDVGKYITWLTESGHVFGTGYNGRKGLAFNNNNTVNYSVLQKIDFSSLTNKKGDRGPAIELEIGTVIAGATPEDVSVVNVGTPSEPIFDFTLPRGFPGYQYTGQSVIVATEEPTGGVDGDLWIVI